VKQWKVKFKEAGQIMESSESAMRDAAIISAAQK
jgi:hypothetical protein